MDHASLGQLGLVPLSEVMSHAEAVADARMRPHQLYRRWEAQQWSAEAIELEPDRQEFRTRLPRAARNVLAESIATFIIGEYTGLDLLGPILTGAPDEIDHLYLGTQIADEARHTRLMLRLGEEVLGLDSDPRRMLAQAWDMVTPAHRDLSLLETEIVDALRQRPGDYRTWLRAVALFHLVTEGMLALIGQRAIVHSLGQSAALPGIRTAFVAMCRDESRHVSFGLHALRVGVAEGYADDICDVIARAAPLALMISMEGQGGPQQLPIFELTCAALERQLRQIGIGPALVDDMVRRSRARVGEAVDGQDSYLNQPEESK